MNKKEWAISFSELIKNNNGKRNIKKRAERILTRISTAKGNITTRGKDNGLVTNIELNDLRDFKYNGIFKNDPFMAE